MRRDDDKPSRKDAQRSARSRLKTRVRVPVVLEKLLFRAAQSVELRDRLMADRMRTLEESRVALRLSERAMLEVIPRRQGHSGHRHEHGRRGHRLGLGRLDKEIAD